ncbi:MAG: peptidylprolyl isomerase [Candidatus Woesearchaeota archaeon]
MGLKNGDFVEIDYVAYDKETGQVFDLTSEEIAKKEGIHDPKAKYGALIVCIGEGFVLKGLDEVLVGKEESEKFDIEIDPEKGFGKRDPKLMKLLSAGIFKKENIRPFPGLRVNLDGLIGTVRSVSGGRIVVDFNHPLAGHKLLYKVTIGKLIKDKQKKIDSLIGFFSKKAKSKVVEAVAEVNGDFSEEAKRVLGEKIKKLIPEMKEVRFGKTVTKT